MTRPGGISRCRYQMVARRSGPVAGVDGRAAILLVATVSSRLSKTGPSMATMMAVASRWASVRVAPAAFGTVEERGDGGDDLGPDACFVVDLGCGLRRASRP